MDDNRLAEKFRALGDPTRMRIFRALLESSISGPGSLGQTASQICQQVAGAGKINSTISHHLKELRQAGLIEVCQQGRCRICRPRTDGVRDMLSFLLDVE